MLWKICFVAKLVWLFRGKIGVLSLLKHLQEYQNIENDDYIRKMINQDQ